MRQMKINRRRARQPSKKRFWCGCDRSTIGQSGSCCHCGASFKGMKDKKPGPTPDRAE